MPINPEDDGSGMNVYVDTQGRAFTGLKTFYVQLKEYLQLLR